MLCDTIDAIALAMVDGACGMLDGMREAGATDDVARYVAVDFRGGDCEVLCFCIVDDLVMSPHRQRVRLRHSRAQVARALMVATLGVCGDPVMLSAALAFGLPDDDAIRAAFERAGREYR